MPPTANRVTPIVSPMPRQPAPAPTLLHSEPVPADPPPAGPLQAGIDQIVQADPQFRASEFITGARHAFEIIVQAFARGDTATLQTLVSPEVFQTFDAVIQQRKAVQQTAESRLERQEEPEIVDARLEGRVAHVTVKFVSDQISVLKAADGSVIDGNEEQADEHIDLWTFARDTRARDPNWVLIGHWRARLEASHRVSKAGAMPKVGLFVTCLVDLFRPSIGFATIRLLRLAGCEVAVPSQSCCGQPAYNSGNSAGAKAVAASAVRAFAPFDYVVAPSGSCAGMIRRHYPALFEDDPELAEPAGQLAAKTYELTEFLVDVMGVRHVPARFRGRVAYHDGCSGLRELGVKAQPRVLLESVEGVELAELPGAEICCGFGGLFSVKYPEISDRMVTDKAAEITASGATTLLAGDLGCLMNITGKLSRAGSAVKVRHIAEILAEATAAAPPIGS